MPTTEYSTSTVRDATFAFLRGVGIKKIFGNPGSTELAMFRDFPDDFEYILGLDEGPVLAMADGYAAATGNATVVNLHSAAGVGNAMGSLFTAYRNQIPMVIIAGQQARSILALEPFLFSERATELPRPYVKWSAEPARAEDVPAAIARAYYIAMQEPRGPTFVSVPSDDWDRIGEPIAIRQVSQEVAPDPQMLEQLGDDLAQAEKPVFVVGQAMANAGVWDEMIALAEAHQAPVFTAPHTGRIAFPEDHPLYAGQLMWDRAPLVRMLEGHDLIVVLGAPAFICHVEGHGPYIPAGSTLWQVIDDPSIASWTPVGSAIVGNLKRATQALLDRKPAVKRSPPSPPQRQQPPALSDKLDAPLLLSRIQAIRADQRVIVIEAPSAAISGARAYLPVSEPNGYYSGASGGLGYGLAAAVGIALAETERRVIALIGDGSSMYAIQALWTAAKLGLPVTFIIINNRSYGALTMHGKLLGLAKPFGTVIDGLDFVKLAGGMNVAAEMVDDPSKLDAALERALTSAGPALLEVLTQAG